MANQQSLLLSISSKTHDDLCNWELISDVSDDDDVSIFGVQSFDLDESIHSLSSSDIDDDLDDVQQEDDEVKDDTHVNNLVNSIKVDNFGLDLSNCDVNYLGYCQYVGGNGNDDTHVDNLVKDDKFSMNMINYGVNYHGYDDVHENVVVDDDDSEDDDGMDDDLVPWEMKGVYMRERIKKSGKKSMVKMGKSSKKVLKSVRKYGLIAY